MEQSKNVTLYKWPASQNCMDCKHGMGITFVDEENIPLNYEEYNSAMLCMEAHINNDGVSCPNKMTQHTKELDCTLDDNMSCKICGAYHGDPCPECGTRGFHKSDCSYLISSNEPDPLNK